MSRYRPTSEEARRAAELLRNRPCTAPPTEGAPRNSALRDFDLAAIPLLKQYVMLEINKAELDEQLHRIARDHGVEHLVDWDEFQFGDREVGHDSACHE